MRGGRADRACDLNRALQGNLPQRGRRHLSDGVAGGGMQCSAFRGNFMRFMLAALLVSSAAIAAPTTALQLGFAAGDDWEPAMAVDGSFAYAFWMHFGAPPADCTSGAGAGYMAFTRSPDGGPTWSAPSPTVCQ